MDSGRVIMPLDTTGDALALTEAIKTITVAGSAFMQPLATILDLGFQKATPSKINLDITVAAGTMVIPYTGTGDIAKIIGVACASYWSSAIGLGTPITLLNVTNVINDASKIALPIEHNIKALTTGVYHAPSYYDFVNAIHKEVLTINWVVTETVPVTPFPVTIT